MNDKLLEAISENHLKLIECINTITETQSMILKILEEHLGIKIEVKPTLRVIKGDGE